MFIKFIDEWLYSTMSFPAYSYRLHKKMVYWIITRIFLRFQFSCNGFSHPFSTVNKIQKWDGTFDLPLSYQLHTHFLSYSWVEMITIVDQRYHPRPVVGIMVHEIYVTTYFLWCGDGRCSYRRGSYLSCPISGFSLFPIWYFIKTNPKFSPYVNRSIQTIIFLSFQWRYNFLKTQSASQSIGTINHSISTPTTVQDFIPSNSSLAKISEVNAV